MTLGKYGSYYCQTKVGDGWCKIKYYPPGYVKKADRTGVPPNGDQAFPISNQLVQPLKVSQDDKWAFLMDKLADMEEKLNSIIENLSKRP